MAQKEWKREEMKQNQGRTEQNQRKKVQKKKGYRAVLAASMFLIAASAALSACKKSPAAETTAQTPAAEETEGAVSTALGAADRVLEENGMLYLKYRTEIRSLSKETGEMKTLCQFDTGDENSTFWVYGGGLYFDRIQAEEWQHTGHGALWAVPAGFGERCGRAFSRSDGSAVGALCVKEPPVCQGLQHECHLYAR